MEERGSTGGGRTRCAIMHCVRAPLPVQPDDNQAHAACIVRMKRVPRSLGSTELLPPCHIHTAGGGLSLCLSHNEAGGLFGRPGPGLRCRPSRGRQWMGGWVDERDGRMACAVAESGWIVMVVVVGC